jgi:hypothetical protein
MDFIANSNCSVLAGHFEIAGFKYMANSSVKSVGIESNIFAKYNLVLSGHYHTPSHSSNIDYLGAQFEFNWSDVDSPRQFHILDTLSLKLTKVRNPNIMFKRIYYNDQEKTFDEICAEIFPEQILSKYVRIIIEHKSDLYQFDRFIKRIQELNPFHLAVIENYNASSSANAGSIDVIEDTTELIDNYIDNRLETGLDRDKLKRVMHRLYNEASLLETTKL